MQTDIPTSWYVVKSCDLIREGREDREVAKRLDLPVAWPKKARGTKRAHRVPLLGGAMVAIVSTVAYLGLEARGVEVQCQITPGLPRFVVVGLPDKAVG